MIVVTVDLVAAPGGIRTPERDRHLATLHISNVGGTDTLGDYSVQAFGEHGYPGKSGKVTCYPRKAVTVLNLVRRAIEAAGYIK